MVLPIKHAASLGGSIIVGVITFFLFFLPDLIKDNRLTLKQGMWITLVLTLSSYGCFWIEKHETAKEEESRNRREEERDRQILELLKSYRSAQWPTLANRGIWGTFNNPIDVTLEVYEKLRDLNDGMTTVKAVVHALGFNKFDETIDTALAELRAKYPDSEFAKIEWTPKAPDIMLDTNGQRGTDRRLALLHPRHSMRAVKNLKARNLTIKNASPARNTRSLPNLYRRRGYSKKLGSALEFTCPVSALSLTRPAVARVFSCAH